MKVSQPNRFGGELIQVRCLENWISVTCQVAITLIVGHHDDDVGFVGGGGDFDQRTAKYQQDDRGYFQW